MNVRQYINDKKLVHVGADDIRDGATGVVSFALGVVTSNPNLCLLGTGLIIYPISRIADREGRAHYLDSFLPVIPRDATKKDE
jgi:hypothetical protein